MAERDTTFIDFYQNLQERTKRLSAWRLGSVIVTGAVLVGLVLFLGSAPAVLVWVVFLFAVTYYGARRLQRAIDVMGAATKHLLEIADQLGEWTSRKQLEDFVKPKRTPHDDSNVPEAIWSYASTFTERSEGARVVANAAYVRPGAELTVAQFLRTALVLGGLFGTVLFFAIELGDTGLLNGDLSSLLPGLRGVLASTLTGILGSVALGIVASHIERVLEEAIWETESFIGGPVAQLLRAPTAKQSIGDEADLWNALREEVAALRADTLTAYTKLADDAHAYAVSLQDVSDKFSSIPAVTIPPEIANLSDSVGSFERSARSLEATVSRLVEAVGMVGLTAPKQMLADLSQLKTTADKHERLLKSVEQKALDERTQIADGIGSIHLRIDQIDANVRNAASNSDVGHVLEAIRASTDAFTETLRESITGIDIRASETNGVLVTHSTDPAPRTRTDDPDGPSRRPSAQTAPTHPTGFEFATDLQHTRRSVDRLAHEMPAHLAQTREQLADMASRLAKISDDLKAIRAIRAWCDRAERAPMMRLLMFSRRRGNVVVP